MSISDQKVLSPNQVSAFYHDDFVESQVRDFSQLILSKDDKVGIVVDIGGGCGYFAESLIRDHGLYVRVIDIDEKSVAECKAKGIDANIGNALAPGKNDDESVVCFNLILHHLVSKNEKLSRDLQVAALEYWRNQPVRIFVNEYIYDSYFGMLSGRLIYEITRSRFLSVAAGLVARAVPSLRANTFGIGVRFRAHEEWLALFNSIGFEVIAYARGSEEHVSLARRMLLIRSCRRDSYVLRENLLACGV